MHREKSHARDQDTRLLLWGLWIIRVQYLGCGCQECPLSVCVCVRVLSPFIMRMLYFLISSSTTVSLSKYNRTRTSFERVFGRFVQPGVVRSAVRT